MFTQEKQSMSAAEQWLINVETMISWWSLDHLLSSPDVMYSWSLACNKSLYKMAHFARICGSPHISSLTFKLVEGLHLPLNQGRLWMLLAALALMSARLCNFNTLLNVRVTLCKDIISSLTSSIKLH